MVFLVLFGTLFYLQSSYVSSQLQESPLCFCAVRNTSLTSGAGVLPFTSVTLNDGGAFDLMSNSFTVPITSTGGYFWLAWSIGLPPSVYADVRLQGASREPNIIRQHSLFTSGVDTTSRTELIDLRPRLDTVTLSTDFSLFSDAGWQTSFCGFSLFSTMSDVVVFNVGRTTTQTNVGTLAYNSINVDTHSGYSTTTGQYTVQVEGVYVVSFSLASTASTALEGNNYATLRVGSNAITTVWVLEAGQDMTTHTVLVDTIMGSILSVYLDNPPAYSDIRYQTSFMGFLYSPTRNLPYAWSVSTENPYSSIDPVPFDIVFVNQGSGWNTATYMYTVQAPGVYYIYLMAGITHTSSGGIGRPAKMELLVNGIVNVNVYRSSIQHLIVDSRGRAIILRLKEGDMLRVRVPSGYYLFSDDRRATTFSGFRLYDF